MTKNNKYLTLKEVRCKYKGKYIEFYRFWDYDSQQYLYEIRKVYKTSHENTTLGEDVETEMEYCR